ncbi:MAG: hypothetical protein ACD_64C00261G0003 [uncultured bacterium]|nr:MAG: hypothetical protein ACD_64C00261G0003 [uncultured bacterium]
MRKKVGYILSVVIGTCIIGLIFFYLFNYFKHRMSARVQQLTQQLDQDMSSLQALGFSPTSELLVTLQAYKDRIAQCDTSLGIDCQQVLALQKKMLMSYIAEVKGLRKQGMSPMSNQMRFAYDKIVRLTIGVAELERQLQQPEDDDSHFQQRIDRMKEITRQSIAYYKQQLQSYAQQEIAESDERMLQARNMLAIRMKHYYQM